MGSDLFFNLRKNRKNKSDPIFHGQSMAEYAILIAIVSAALLAMQVYMRRGIQGVIKAAADDVGKQEDSRDEAEKGPSLESTYSTNASKTGEQREYANGSTRSEIDETQHVSGESTTTQWQDK